MTTTPTPAQILATPMAQPNDAHAATIGDYLTTLLTLLWVKREDFDGKRPFGYSGWDADLYIALVRAGHIDGRLDEDGYLEILEIEEEDRGTCLITAAVRAALGAAVTA